MRIKSLAVNYSLQQRCRSTLYIYIANVRVSDYIAVNNKLSFIGRRFVRQDRDLNGYMYMYMYICTYLIYLMR